MKPNSVRPEDHSTSADAEAARWASRLDAGPLTSVESGELQRWLAQAPLHHCRLDDSRRVLSRLGRTVPLLVEARRLSDPLDQPARRIVRPSPAIFLRRSIAAVTVAAALVVAALLWTGRPQLLETAAAHRQAITLADGSNVDLNARTQLAVSLGRAERHVTLSRGEAYFSVAKDPGRPFIIDTAAGSVRVTGTAFNVRYTAPDRIEVTVLEGAVTVTPGDGAGDTATRRLTPKDQLTLGPAGPALVRLTERAAQDLTAWREGKLIVENARLDAVVDHFARYHDRTITVAPEIAALRLGGRFRLDELDAFIRDLPSALPVQSLRGDDGRIRILAR
ncbi:MAG: hypothetical protein CK538_08445 [Opitutia bacterium]|nr:hypothetical protein [Opitutaceae bacterium]PHX85097.1 MAG: hypothetical protein CK538_08445 [Opitutae bacterium]